MRLGLLVDCLAPQRLRLPLAEPPEYLQLYHAVLRGDREQVADQDADYGEGVRPFRRRLHLN